MENAQLRNAILKGFSRLPGSNSILCCLRFSKIRALFTDVDKCVQSLTRDGLLDVQIHGQRLPNSYCLSGSGQGMVRLLGPAKDLSPYEVKILDVFHEAEVRSATLQRKALKFFHKHSHIYPSLLMIQCHLKVSHLETIAILCELVKTKDVQSINNQLLWVCTKEKD